MKSVYTSKCHEGDILAADVVNEKGLILVAKNTIINAYIKAKLMNFGILEVKIYETTKNDSIYAMFERNYIEYVYQMKELLRCITQGNYEEIEKIADYLTDEIYNHLSESDYVIHCMNRIRSNDEYTYTHSINTAYYAMLMGSWLGFTKNQIGELICAALLHDIGKTMIPNEILNKKGKLDPEEFEIIKTHPVRGHEIIKDMPSISKDIKEAVLMHHERMDGSGYPYGMKGMDINQFARIISIADVYDAMTQNRIYKNKVSPFESFSMFLAEGLVLFDYPILYNFLKHIAPLYVGNKVQLSNGDIGEIVYIPPQDITSPILYSNSQYLDLSRTEDIKVLQVL